jgi:DNA-directed RNA polymerase subunit RPC12/RpoP
LCPDCGKEPEDKRYVKCESCRERVREAQAK